MILAVGCSDVFGRSFDMATALTLLLLSGLGANGTSQSLSPGGRVNLAQTFTPPAEIRHDTSLVDGWRFIKSDVTGADQESFDDQSWAVISIPHTWNALDGQDGGNDYYR